MTEKSALAAENSQMKKERFEFVLDANGFMICQRYFRIYGFKEESLTSNEIEETVRRCAEIIKEDLKAKSNIYSWYMAPQVFNNKEEMEKKIASKTFNAEVPSYITISDTNETFVWDGEKATPYDKPFNGTEFSNSENEKFILTFTFKENGNEVASYSWDGSVYPKFVRNNIDLSNTKNKYDTDEARNTMECFMINRFIASQSKDIIPTICKAFFEACTYQNSKDYSNTLSITNFDPVLNKNVTTNYNVPANARAAYNKVVKAMEKKYHKKTAEYFKNLY